MLIDVSRFMNDHLVQRTIWVFNGDFGSYHLPVSHHILITFMQRYHAVGNTHLFCCTAYHCVQF